MFPGGGINKGEALEDAARREVFEETGVRVFDLNKIGEYKSNKEYKRDTVFVFAGRSESKDIVIDPKEIAEAQWFDLNNLPEISPYSGEMLEMFKGKN